MALIKLFSLPRFFCKTQSINCSLESLHQQYSEGMLKRVQGGQRQNPRAFLAGSNPSLPVLVAGSLLWSEVPPLPGPASLRDSPPWSCRVLVRPSLIFNYFSWQLCLRTQLKKFLCTCESPPCPRQYLATP